MVGTSNDLIGGRANSRFFGGARLRWFGRTRDSQHFSWMLRFELAGGLHEEQRGDLWMKAK